MNDNERVVVYKKLIHLEEKEGQIDLQELRTYLLQPFPDGHPDLRFYNWQISLNALPMFRERWEDTWKNNEFRYYGLVQKIFRDCPDFLSYGLRGGDFLETPEVMLNIHSDVIRMPRIKSALEEFLGSHDDIMPHLYRIERFLYIFSLVNQYCPYTQGFHELAAPLYYVALTGTRFLDMTDDRAESIAFFLLFNLIVNTKLYNVFTWLGDLELMQTHFSTIETAVRIFDSQFADYLFIERNIQPLLFSVPWVSLLFAQSLNLNDLLHLWDHLLVFRTQLVEFVMMVCAAYLLFRKKHLKELDYENCMIELHATPELNVIPLLRIARNLWEEYVSQHRNQE